MATFLENLTARRNAIAAELAALTATTAGGKPNASATGIDHVGYKMGLYRELEEIEKRIAAAGGSITDNGPWEEMTIGVT